MTQLFLQLTQSVTGNVVTIVALDLVAAIIGFAIAWFYAKSVYTPVIKGLETDKANLNTQVAKLTDEYARLSENVSNLNVKIAKLEEDLVAKDNEIKELSEDKTPVGKYVISKAKNGEYYFNLKATNGQVILTSGMHSSMTDCTDAIFLVREVSADDKWYDRKTSSDNKPYFNLKGSEGQILGRSEMYESMTNMEKGISSVKRNGISTAVVEE
jgi:uncharacterized protein YegP (UPF0339 family)/outer membrane murein-binding lipoprotein Lpp